MGYFDFNKNNGERKAPLPTSLMLLMRILVGGYLIYLAYQLFADKSVGSIPRGLTLAFAAVFGLVGLAVAFIAVRNLLSGYYQGGTMDVESSSDEDVVENVENKTDMTDSATEDIVSD